MHVMRRQRENARPPGDLHEIVGVDMPSAQPTGLVEMCTTGTRATASKACTPPDREPHHRPPAASSGTHARPPRTVAILLRNSSPGPHHGGGPLRRAYEALELARVPPQ